MEFVILWPLLAIIVGVAASSRGRSGIGWFLLSMLVSPLIAGLFLLAVGSNVAPVMTDVSGEPVSPETHVRCPDCRELVRADAKKCKHCGIALIPQKI